MTSPQRARFGTRLFLGTTLVVLVCLVTATVVAVVIAPGMFHEHLHQAGISGDDGLTDHIEMAFRGTLLRAWAPAAAAAVVVAIALSWWVARRVERAVGELSTSTGRIAAGRYETRVDASGLGREFAELADAVNELARRLHETETTRRRMVADLGHEMRTPIATIESHLEAVEDGVRAADADTIGVLRTGTQRLRRLAEDLSAVSRVQEGIVQEGIDRIRPEPTGARRLVDAAVAVATPSYDAAGVALAATGDDIPLTVDPARVGQVLGNLFDNARRHTPPGGTVTVTTTHHGPDVVFTVADTGCGIAAEHLSHVFDRFYRADDARTRRDGGSGIGLTIVRVLVEAHGGSVTASSAGPGAGAVFTVTLPAAGPASAEPSDRPANLDS
ncbi:HAMP domain-containing histidine kinase [Gordonia sp. HY285]|uniref:sensor histidine kinase n=1 Tax=Gordonia liuliyuniae TaxID=2911517 RepID=UPI001F3E804C|nr:HAMP domain-containing sensor histidine kinase [Gordonia liuliyuniae]MCF8611456.1 HAMP domain-containing histidine kinase [Gordonia liuliyuniae]